MKDKFNAHNLLTNAEKKRILLNHIFKIALALDAVEIYLIIREMKFKLTELEALKSEHDVVKAVIEENITRNF